jgi:hypothetical protein
MKLLVNCDQVFDVLTRGPFPTGEASDEAVEQHLRVCHDCRQLAEALRPAISLLHEAVSASQGQSLPEYQGSLPVLACDDDPYASPRPLALGLRQLDRRPQPAKRTVDFTQFMNGLRLVAASVLVVALGTMAWGLVMSARNSGVTAGSPTRPAPTFRGIAAARPDERGLIKLASLQLPGACFPPQLTATVDVGTTLESALAGSNDALRCCTHCHADGKAAANVQVAANTRFVQGCAACHRG